MTEEKKKEEIVVGSVVHLKSSGFKVTVFEVTAKTLRVVYFVDEKLTVSDKLPIECFNLVNESQEENERKMIMEAASEITQKLLSSGGIQIRAEEKDDATQPVKESHVEEPAAAMN